MKTKIKQPANDLNGFLKELAKLSKTVDEKVFNAVLKVMEKRTGK